MANEFIGRQVEFAIALEDVRGTGESVAARTVRKVTANLIPRSDRVIDDTTNGRIEDAENIRTVRRWSEGDVDGIVHADVIGYYFYSIYGAVVSNTVSGATTHAFTLEQSITHPTITGFIKDGEVRQEKVAGMLITTLELTATTDDYVRFTAGFIGKESVTDVSVIPSLATEYDFVSRDITVKIADTEGGLSGASALLLKNINISWNTNAIADFVFGSYSPNDIYNKQISIEGSFTKNYVDTTFQDLYEANGSKFMSIVIEGEATIGSGSAKPKIALQFDKVQITDWNRGSEGDELVTEEVSFKAFLNATSGQQSELTLVNLTADYATGS
jgi:hypothetical protein